ncbi:hypothetical protein BJY04DRAFT_218370 [Aspergillus karnatakaensis]|uniref:2EXR domain-containing protein n=1 Tax=Aspergillus karnatakaensis TaxID=1810916 RepID=UPI003CCD3F72
MLPPEYPCPHPSTSLFDDPRAPKPSLLSKTSILRDLLRENRPSSDYGRSSTQLVSRNENQDKISDNCAFSHFTRLPREIRDMIWHLSIPQRTLNTTAIEDSHAVWLGPEIFKLSVPSLARVCREAREAVFRKGKKISLYPNESLHGGDTLERLAMSSWGDRNESPLSSTQDLPSPGFGPASPEFHSDFSPAPCSPRSPVLTGNESASEPVQSNPAGFLMPHDRLLYMCPPRRAFDGEPKETVYDTTSNITTADSESLPRILGSREIAVSWPDPHRFLRESPFPHPRPHGLRTQVEVWRFLRDLGCMDTIVVLTCSNSCVPVCFETGEYPHEASVWDFWPSSGGFASQYFFPEHGIASVIVDLYDDQKLAEVTSLHTPDEQQDDQAAMERRFCINCEREIWERQYKNLIERFWLLLHADELDQVEAQNVFPELPAGMSCDAADIAPYNPDNAWVREKLAQAPEFRPAVKFHLRPVGTSKDKSESG